MFFLLSESLTDKYEARRSTLKLFPGILAVSLLLCSGRSSHIVWVSYCPECLKCHILYPSVSCTCSLALGCLWLLFSLSVMSDSFATPWTVARQASLSMGFPRQEYCSGLPFPSPGDHGFRYCGILKNGFRASLIVQWLRFCLAMQGIMVRSLVQEDLIC